MCEKITKHNKYKIISCKREDNYYICECVRCKKQFKKDKVKGEMYGFN